jgi:hypothetical protein
MNSKDKIVIKVENLITSRTHGSPLTNESYYLRIINEDHPSCWRIIRYFGDGFVMGSGA